MTATDSAARPSIVAAKPIQMIRADLDVKAFHRWSGARGLISHNAFDEGFAMHCLLVERLRQAGAEAVPRDHPARPRAG